MSWTAGIRCGAISMWHSCTTFSFFYINEYVDTVNGLQHRIKFEYTGILQYICNWCEDATSCASPHWEVEQMTAILYICDSMYEPLRLRLDLAGCLDGWETQQKGVWKYTLLCIQWTACATFPGCNLHGGYNMMLLTMVYLGRTLEIDAEWFGEQLEFGYRYREDLRYYVDDDV